MESLKKSKNKDVHPLAINILKLQRYNYDYFNCEEVVFFEYIVVKGMAFKKKKEFFHSSETIRKETGIKKSSLKTIIKKFIDLGILSTEVKGMPRVTYFKVHFPKIIELFHKIYQLNENGTLPADFSKQLSEFFNPLVDNYQEKNNIKNNNEDIIKEKNNTESEELNNIDIFNSYISKLSYEQNRRPNTFIYNEVDLFRALNEYEVNTLSEYVGKYFEEEPNPTLIKFFAFDKISANKIIYIEQKMSDEKKYVESLLIALQSIYDKRIEMYNKDDKYPRAKSKTKLVITERIKENLKEALNHRSELQITNAFTPYIDDLLRNNLNVKKTLPYFLAEKDGEYEIIDIYLEQHNLSYSYIKK